MTTVLDKIKGLARERDNLRDLLAQRVAEIERLNDELADAGDWAQRQQSVLLNWKQRAEQAEALESQQAASVGGEPYPHGHELHKAVFMALECFTGSDTFEDGVRGLIAELKEARAALSPAGGGVVMPERRKEYPGKNAGFGPFGEGWNACLDEVARLNAKPQAE